MNATDRIDYARPFAQDVRGVLYARFRLDADGAPMYALVDRVRYYTIDICLHSPRAGEIDEVAYYLESAPAPAPLGESTDRVNDFPATIECPGDDLLRVQVRIGGRTYEQRAWVSQMLDNGYPAKPSAAVQEALLHVRVY